VIFDEVKIQSLRLRQVKGLVIDGASPGDALLGQSFLNRLDIHREGAVPELRGR
jgi:predicted aspartyl protease